MYQSDNIFCKILQGLVPVDIVHENDHAMAFRDIHPQAPTHYLVIPKGLYENAQVFYEKGSSEEIIDFHRVIAVLTAPLTQGFRLISNNGFYGGQEVPHFHMHILSGKILGKMLSES